MNEIERINAIISYYWLLNLCERMKIEENMRIIERYYKSRDSPENVFAVQIIFKKQELSGLTQVLLHDILIPRLRRCFYGTDGKMPWLWCGSYGEG